MKARKLAKKAGQITAGSAALGALFATIAGRFGALNHYLDLASHFTPYYCFAAIAAAATFVCTRNWTAALASVLCGLPAFVVVAPLYIGSEGALRVGNSSLSVAAVNVNADRIDYKAFTRFARELQPDVLCLSEINPGWATALEALNDLYPHQVLHPRKGHFGIALLSRLPIRESTIHPLGPDRPDLREIAPCIEARVEVNGETVTVIAVHVYAPFTPLATKFRDQQLADLGEVLADINGPVVIAGDLNLTPWSPRYASYVESWAVQDGRVGRGMYPTFPARFPLIPIDHVLSRGGAAVVGLWRGPDIGSDHLPLLASIWLSGEP